MTRGRATVFFAVALLLLLLFQFRDLLAPGMSLYLSLVDDPGAWWSWYPWDVFAARSLRAGAFPLWNPLSGTGFPHLANFASNVFTPLKWPFYLFPHYRLLDAMVLARVWLLGIFTFLYLSRLGLRHQSATAGAMALALSGYVMEYVNIFNLATEMWLPAALYLLHGQIQDRPTLRRFLLLGLVSALALTGGNPEAAFYYLLFLLLYAVSITDFRGSPTRAALPSLSAVMAPLILAGLLMLAQGIPLVEYLGQGWHIHTGKLHALATLDPRRYWSLLMPWLIGPNHTSDLQIFMLPYLGVLTVGLALIGFTHLRYSAGTPGALGPRVPSFAQPLFFFLLYILCFLGLIYNLPGFRWLGEIPPFRQSGNFKFAMFGIALGIAAAAAFGLEHLISGRIERRRLGASLALTMLLTFLGIALAWRDPELPPVQRPGWLPSLLLLTSFAALLLFFRRGFGPGGAGPLSRGISRTPAHLLVGLLLLELLLLYPGLGAEGEIDPAAVAARHPRAPAYLDPIQRDPGHYRFTGQGRVIHHSLNLLYGLADLRAFEALYPRDYVKTMARIEGFEMDQAVEQFFRHGWSFDVRPENLNSPLVSLLGVKYFLTSAAVQAPPWQLLRRETVFTYLNPNVFPRAFLWPPGSLPELESPAALPATRPAPAAIRIYEPERVVIEAASETPAELVLTDTYFPGWQAWVKGKEVKIAKVAGLVRGVPVPAGKTRVEMVYRPWGFRMGLWGSFISGLLGSGLVLARIAGGRRRRTGAGDTQGNPSDSPEGLART